MKIALFLPNWIGDAVMATPALRRCGRNFKMRKLSACCDLPSATCWLDSITSIVSSNTSRTGRRPTPAAGGSCDD